MQKVLKSKDVRVRLEVIKKAASKIQGWIKSIWLRRMMEQIKQAATIIQVIVLLITSDSIEFIMNVQMRQISKRKNTQTSKTFS